MGDKPRSVNAVAYVRVSTLLNQDPELQLTNIREFAKARGLKLSGEYIDKGISGTREKRPALDRLIGDAKTGKLQLIIVTGIDRLGRDTKHLLNLLDELKHYGVSLISIREQLDFSSPTGQMALTMLSAVAQLEKQLISERIKTSLAAKKVAAASSGSQWRCGRPLLTTPAMIEKVLALRAQGLSVRQIEKALDRAISRGSVQRIIKGCQK